MTGRGATSLAEYGVRTELRTRDPILTGIYHIMSERKISPDRLAKSSGVSDNAIRRWFYGTSNPSLDNLRAVCNALDLDLSLIGASWLESSAAFFVQQPSADLLSAIHWAISSNRFDNRELATLAATSATALSLRLTGKPVNGGPNAKTVT